MRGGRWWLVATVAVVVVALDQLTKWWALEELSDQSIQLVGSLQLRLARNTGAAFSIGAGSGVGRWLPLVAIVVVVAVATWGGAARARLGAVATGLVIGGAVGNLADRLFRAQDGLLSGSVVDFVDVGWWPVFNVADSAISVGCVLLLVQALWSGAERDEEAIDAEEAASTGDGP